VGIYVGPRVLSLAVLGKDSGDNLIQLLDESEERVLGQMLEGELLLAGVAGIGLPQDGMAVSGDDLAGVEDVPELLLQLIVVDVLASELFPQLHDEAQHLLVSQAVQRASKTGHTAGEGEVRIG